MAGVNHEFARELLWREYPTDCRGSPFRQFWDVSSVQVPTPDLTAPRARQLKDIKPLHEWAGLAARHARQSGIAASTGERVVLVIRGDLLKRYPNTIIYAQRARWSTDPRRAERARAATTRRARRRWPASTIRTSRFRSSRRRSPPDLNFVGFELTLDEVRGDPALDETAEARADDPGRPARLVLRAPGGGRRAALRPRRAASASRARRATSSGTTSPGSNVDMTGPADRSTSRSRSSATRPAATAGASRRTGRRARAPRPPTSPRSSTRSRCWSPGTRARCSSAGRSIEPGARCLLAMPERARRRSARRAMRPLPRRARSACAPNGSRAASRADARRARRSGRRREAASLDREIAALEARPSKRARRDAALRDRVSACAHWSSARVPSTSSLTQLDDHVPFLLFPVRLETKFAHDGERRAPARAHLPRRRQHLDPRSAAERGRARIGRRLLGRARARARALDADERRDGEQGAWTLLATRYGGPRARYVARQTKPAVWPPSARGGRASAAADDEPSARPAAPRRRARVCCPTTSW